MQRAQIRQILDSPRPQFKLTIGAPNDVYEQEAHRVADEVMRMPDPVADEQRVQRMCPECEEGLQRQQVEELEEEEVQRPPVGESEEEVEDLEETQTLQAKSNLGGRGIVDSGVASEINSLRGGGEPLPEPARRFFEPRFARDFGSVRVHKDGRAAETARAINARAYTLGNDVTFAEGEYAPASPDGQRLLAHELTHVVQQTRGSQRPSAVGAQTKVRLDRQSPSRVLSRKTKGKCTKPFDGAKYLKATVKTGDSSMEAVVNRLIKQRTINVNGRRSVYASEMQRLNYKRGAFMHVRDCLIMLRTWNDPNIGKLPSQSTIQSDLLAKVIATIYGEQTQDVPDQHKNIWYAIRKRIQSWEKPARLIYPGRKKGVLSEFDAFKKTTKHYKWAKEYVMKGKTKLPKHKFSPDVVNKIAAIVKNEWTTNIPRNVGMLYFHWTAKDSPTLNRCWNKKENRKRSDADRERICVEEYRRDLNWQAKLVKTIRGNATHKKGSPPIGTMYIFQSNRRP